VKKECGKTRERKGRGREGKKRTTPAHHKPKGIKGFVLSRFESEKKNKGVKKKKKKKKKKGRSGRQRFKTPDRGWKGDGRSLLPEKKGKLEST